MVDHIRHAQRFQAGAHPREVRRARVAQVVQEVRRVLRRLPAFVGLAVEHAQGVLEVPRPVGRTELIGALGQERAEQRDVAGLADPVAHGVQLQLDLAQPETREEVVRQRDHLDVEVGVGRPERLHPQLGVLAIAPVLGVLVAERGRGVPGLPRRDRVVLHERAHDRRRPLRAQRHHLAVAVLEDVHLLAHDLTALADPAQEHAGMLDDGRQDQAVAGALHQRREPRHRRLPTRRLRPQHVVHALGRAEPAFGRDRSRRHRGRLTAGDLSLLARELTIGVEDTVEMLQRGDQANADVSGPPARRRRPCG